MSDIDLDDIDLDDIDLDDVVEWIKLTTKQSELEAVMSAAIETLFALREHEAKKSHEYWKQVNRLSTEKSLLERDLKEALK